MAFAGFLAVALVGAAVVAPRIQAHRLRRSAERSLAAGEISAAQASLTRAELYHRNDFRNDLARAACFRHLGEREEWRNAVKAARRHGAVPAAVALEQDLGALRFGDVDSISRDEYDGLIKDGAAPFDALTCLIHGLLAKGEIAKAREQLEAWQGGPTDAAQAAFLAGLCDWTADQPLAAQVQFERALKEQPRHEMARTSLGRLLEQQERLALAAEHYAYLGQVAPHRQSVRVDLARVLRKMGRIEDSRAALEQPPAPDNVPVSVALELAEREYESGNYDAAREWFERIDLDGAHAAETLRTAASNSALGGDFAAATRLFQRVDDAQAFSRQAGELQRRLTIDPGDQVAAEELEHLLKQQSAPGVRVGESLGPRGSALYQERCGACHGPQGRGDGPAARHLFPRPRDFVGQRFRLVSSVNLVPTKDDIERVIRLGIPGTSMPPFPELAPEQRLELVEQVQRFQRSATEGGLAAGDMLEVPQIDEATPESLARGRELYATLGCRHCHGDDGSGETSLLLMDDTAQPALPRDLILDPMKGGSDPLALFRRIRLGMPGTPHPGVAGLEDMDVVALVHFCQSIAKEPKRALTNHQRATRAAHK